MGLSVPLGWLVSPPSAAELWKTDLMGQREMLGGGHEFCIFLQVGYCFSLALHVEICAEAVKGHSEPSISRVPLPCACSWPCCSEPAPGFSTKTMAECSWGSWPCLCLLCWLLECLEEKECQARQLQNACSLPRPSRLSCCFVLSPSR